MSDSIVFEPMQSDENANVIIEGRFGTGCRAPTEQSRKVASTYEPFEKRNVIWDKKDVEKVMKMRDYRKLREARRKRVINQGRIGKCNASALKGALHQVREDQGFPFVEFSDAWAYMHMNGGVDQGSNLEDALKLCEIGNAPKKLSDGSEIPETAFRKNQISPQMLALANKMAKDYTAHEVFATPEKWDDFVPVVATAIAKGFPIVFAWHVGNDGYNLRSDGYVRQGSGVGNHANMAHSGKWVGGTEWIHPDDQNSWGTEWGEGGFGLFTMGDFFQCRKYHMFYIVTSMNPSPKDMV